MPEIENYYLEEPLSIIHSHVTDNEGVKIASSSTASDTGGESLLWLQRLASAARDSALLES